MIITSSPLNRAGGDDVDVSEINEIQHEEERVINEGLLLCDTNCNSSGGGDIDMISPVTTTPTPIITSSSGGGNIGSNSIKTIPSLQEWLKTAHVVNTTTAGGCDKCNGSGNGGISSTTTITNGSGGSVKDIINMSSSEMESR